MPRFPITKALIKGSRVQITGADHHHITRVLRLGSGSRITLFEPDGTEHTAIITSAGGHVLDLEITGTRKARRESPVRITLVQAIPRGRKLDLVVEKATELGVWEIRPMLTHRTQGRGAGKVERWRRIAREAAKQCGRTSVPTVHEPEDFSALIERSDADSRGILLYEEGVSALSPSDIEGGTAFTLFVGPEGGFTEEEVGLAEAKGVVVRGLGPRLLRTETAGIAVSAIVQFTAGGMVGDPS